MKVLLLPAYFHPETIASSYLSENRNKAFTEAGVNIVAYVPTPCRGISEDVRKEYCKKEHKNERLYNGKMLVHRYSLYGESKNPILRALRYSFNWLIQLWYGLTEKNVDCIFLASTPPIQGMIGSIVRIIRRIPFVYNLQDIFPDSLVAGGLASKKGFLWKIGRVIENFTYKHADKIIVISQDFKRNIMEKGVPEEKIEVVYNWVDQNAVRPIVDDENPLFKEFGIAKDKFRVVYAGNLGNSQNIEIILKTAKKLSSNNNIEFLIFGSGGLEENIRTEIKENNLPNVKLLPIQPYERVSYVYGLGNICVVSCKAGFGGSAMPSKTWNILSAGRPVLASFDEGELKYTLEQNGMGVYSKAEDVEDFSNKVLELSNNKDFCAEMGKNGRKFILDNLTREVGTQRYVDIIKEVINL